MDHLAGGGERGGAHNAWLIILPLQNRDGEGGVETLEEGETADSEGEGDAIEVELVEPWEVLGGTIAMLMNSTIVQHGEYGVSR